MARKKEAPRLLCCTCKLSSGTQKSKETRHPNHEKNCPMFVPKELFRKISKAMRELKKFDDPRSHELHKLARRHLKIESDGDKWCLYYKGRGVVIGLIPTLIPLPIVVDEKLKPKRVSAQIRGALVSFALDVLDDKSGRFEKKDDQ